jgi:hypothetical protein
MKVGRKPETGGWGVGSWGVEVNTGTPSNTRTSGASDVRGKEKVVVASGEGRCCQKH